MNNDIKPSYNPLNMSYTVSPCRESWASDLHSRQLAEDDVYNMYNKATTFEAFVAADVAYITLRTRAGNDCSPAPIYEVLTRYKNAIIAQLAKNPLQITKALSEQQQQALIYELNQQQDTLNEELNVRNKEIQSSTAAVEKAKTQNVALQDELDRLKTNINKLKTMIANMLVFNVEKKSSQNPLKGYQETIFSVMESPEHEKSLNWTSRSNKDKKDILINTISNINMNIKIKGKNNKKENVTLDLKSIDSSPNDLIYLYAHASGLLSTATQLDKPVGGKKLSHYKKTKNKKFNSKQRLTSKSKTKKTKKRK